LDDSSEKDKEYFLYFLNNHAKKFPNIFILGDLFDWWPGDDTYQFKKIISGLKKLSKKSKLFFICGNRDYLIGKKFAKETKITLLSDHELIQLGNESAIILHGDTLCTDDKNYQRFRQFSRAWISKKGYLLFPKFLKDYIFKLVRKKSNNDKSFKVESIMDVNEDSVKKLFKKYNYPSIMIHGHTHRPKVHRYKFNGINSERWVLSDWYKSGSFLSWKNGKLKNIKI